MIRFRVILTCAMAWLAAAGSSIQAQMPRMEDTREFWQGELEGSQLRVWHIPKKPSTLIPLRFGLHEMLRSDTANRPFQAFDAFEIVAIDGTDARRSYVGKQAALIHWSDTVNEGRETFRAPGTYRFRLLSSSRPNLVIEWDVEVTRHQYLPFGLEMAAFISGCLVLGAFLLFVVITLHRRTRPAPKPSGSPEPDSRAPSPDHRELEPMSSGNRPTTRISAPDYP
jgi:hypothetical protein